MKKKATRRGKRLGKGLDLSSKTAKRDEFLENYLDDKRNMLTFATWKEKTK